MRPLGKITDDLEPLLYELVHEHGLQKHEVIALVAAWIDCHYPSAVEKYDDKSIPVLFYGHRDAIIIED